MIAPRRSRLGLSAWCLPAFVLSAGLALVVLGDRSLLGGYLMGSAFLTGALLRLVLPEDRAGGIAVRSRTLDVFTLVVLGGSLIVVFSIVDFR